jgi:hypothetical protein
VVFNYFVHKAHQWTSQGTPVFIGKIADLQAQNVSLIIDILFVCACVRACVCMYVYTVYDVCSRVSHCWWPQKSNISPGPEGYPFGQVVEILDFHAGDLGSNPGRLHWCCDPNRVSLVGGGQKCVAGECSRVVSHWIRIMASEVQYLPRSKGIYIPLV